MNRTIKWLAHQKCMRKGETEVLNDRTTEMENWNCLFKWQQKRKEKEKHFSNRTKALWCFCAQFFSQISFRTFFFYKSQLLFIDTNQAATHTHKHIKKIKHSIKAHSLFSFFVVFACGFFVFNVECLLTLFHWSTAIRMQKQRENGTNKLKADATNRDEGEREKRTHDKRVESLLFFTSI